jgi:hypothetical protein
MLMASMKMGLGLKCEGSLIHDEYVVGSQMQEVMVKHVQPPFTAPQ